MSRKKGARLFLRSERRDAVGNVTHAASWYIRDGAEFIGTGCLEAEVGKAEKALATHIASKHAPARKEQDIEAIAIADVLAIFAEDRPELYEGRDAQKYLNRMDRLNDFWGSLMLSDVNRKQCNAFTKKRGNTGGARRDLEDLRAAIAHHAAEGFHRGIVKVKLPKKGKPRDRWLTRSEAARLLWECWRAREVQNWSGIGPVVTDKRPLRHIARFILIGLYSGTRAAAIASASPIPAIGRSYVDLERGLFYRLAQGQAETNKRQPPMPIPPRLLTHMRRWHDRKIIARHFVEWNGKGVKSVKTGFKTAVDLAKLGPGVSPHTLRHTAATWLMQNGTDEWQAAGFLGMSQETLRRTYGHHHPEYLADAVGKMTAKPVRAKAASATGAPQVKDD